MNKEIWATIEELKEQIQEIGRMSLDKDSLDFQLREVFSELRSSLLSEIEDKFINIDEQLTKTIKKVLDGEA